MPGMELFGKSATKTEKKSTATVASSSTEAKKNVVSEAGHKEFSLDSMGKEAMTRQAPTETVSGSQVGEFSMDRLQTLLHQSISELEDMSAIQTEPAPMVVPPRSEEDVEMGVVEEVSAEELLGIVADKKNATPVDDRTVITDTNETLEKTQAASASEFVEESPVEAPKVTTPEESEEALPDERTIIEESSVAVEEEIADGGEESSVVSVSQTTDNSSVEESADEVVVEEEQLASGKLLEEVTDRDTVEDVADIESTSTEEEVEEAEGGEESNPTEVEEPEGNTTVTTEEISEQAENTETLPEESPEAARIASLEQEVADLRQSVGLLTRQLQRGTQQDAASVSEDIVEHHPVEEGTTTEELPEESIEEHTDVQVDGMEGYFPFIEEARSVFQMSIANLRRYQRLEDVGEIGDRPASPLSPLRGILNRRPEVNPTERAMSYRSFQDIDIVVQSELDLAEDVDEGEFATSGPEYGIASAMFGAWVLHAVDESCGCTDVDFGVEEDDADGNVLVVFDDFASVYAGFKSMEDAENFCLFLHSYTACHVSDTTAEDRENIYHPFKKGLKGQALELLDISQIYQAQEDYKSEPHGIAAILDFIRGGQMDDPYGGQYGSGYQGQYGSGYSSQYGGQYGGGYGGQYGSYSGSYSQYNNPYGNAGMHSGGFFGRNRGNMMGRSPYGSTAYGRQDPMNRPRGLARLFGPKVDRFGRPKKSLKKRFDDMIERGLENRISRCRDLRQLQQMVQALDKRVKGRLRRKIISGRWYADYHVMGLGAIAAYKTLQMTLDKNSGVRDILVGQVQGGQGGPAVEFVDFCELRLTFVSPNAADAFVSYLSDRFNVVRVA